MSALRQFPGVSNVQTFGERAHVQLAQASGDAVAQLGAHLRNAGIDVTTVRQVPPSLEDVFVTRLGELQS